MEASRMDKFLMVKEICGMLKVKRGTVIRWIRAGRMRAFKLGGGRLWRIRERDLKRFVASSSAGSTSAKEIS
jgi:excisionase family DNA binding protein